ncbi:MAG TPA: hypothetical protein VK790_07230 [Solirubrobacteraceae bacterium]|nr:hypothetical protein [Solirubrobacteraceae bacterium]
MEGDTVEIDLGYPWGMRASLADNIEGNTEIVLSQVQAELAEATTEPWPVLAGSRTADARGLTDLEAKLVGDVLELRFRSGSKTIELRPIDLKVKHGSP